MTNTTICSKESEMMVLGCMLTGSTSLSIGCKSLSDTDFYFPEHKIIFRTIKSLHNEDKPADVHLTCEELKRQEKLGTVGGILNVTTIAQYAATSVYFDDDLEILKRLSRTRALLTLSSDISKSVERGGDPGEIIITSQEALKSIERNKGVKDKFPIKFLNEFGENFLLVEPPAKAMLLNYINDYGHIVGALPKGIVAMIVGAGGVGKTHLVTQLAIAVATGTPFLNIFNPTAYCGQGNQGNVFLGFGENQNDDIHRLLYKTTKRLREKGDKQALDTASNHIAAFSFCGQQASFIEDGRPSRYFREFKMRLEDKAPENGWTLIILDPVSRLLGADAETDNAAATQFIALLEELTIDLPGNPTVLFAHHVNKAAIQSGANQNQTAARGSSALTDGVRQQFNYAKDPNDEKGGELKMTKSNFTAIMQTIRTIKEEDGFIIKRPNELTGKAAIVNLTRKKKQGSRDDYEDELMNS
jgi:hypothetical protein